MRKRSFLAQAAVPDSSFHTEENTETILKQVSETDGRILLEIPWKGGSISGIARSYYENGALRIETSYQNGRKEGIRRYYYRDGTLYKEVPYENDVKNGLEKGFYPDGARSCEMVWKNGCLNGAVRLYYQQGGLLNETPYQNGLKHGVERWYYADGSYHFIPYRNDQRQGIEILFDASSAATIETVWDKDVIVGVRRMSDIEGEITDVSRFVKKRQKRTTSKTNLKKRAVPVCVVKPDPEETNHSS